MAVFSLIDRGSTTLRQWLRHSRGYRWLTVEPDSEVIVIDLRETWTIGPILAILDHFVASIIRTAGDSTAITLGGRLTNRTLSAPIQTMGFVLLGLAFLTAVSTLTSDQMSGLFVALGFAVVGGLALFETRSWGELRETQLVELLVATFEPPDPPNSTNSAHTVDNDEKVKTDTGNPAGDSETSHTNTNADVGDDDTGIERNER